MPIFRIEDYFVQLVIPIAQMRNGWRNGAWYGEQLWTTIASGLYPSRPLSLYYFLNTFLVRQAIPREIPGPILSPAGSHQQAHSVRL